VGEDSKKDVREDVQEFKEIGIAVKVLSQQVGEDNKEDVRCTGR
jgi:hypothetical protein